ncbi:hypothetical protein [Streptomyces sp. NPDC001380]|uniref:hypothetical protein n=1 Tax=Streptomyces sp. NPDC001380 TaxID=3364566 RepID=UPI0036C66FDE
MFRRSSRKERPPTRPELARAWEQVAAGDVPGALRELRSFTAQPEPVGDDLGELARVVARAAAACGFDDLATAGTALAEDSRRPRALYDFGYACVERGVSYLAVPALREALRQVPDARGIRAELVSALEDEHRHSEAVQLLAEREDVLEDWPERYLLACNALMAGDLDRAAGAFRRLAPPPDPWPGAHGRLGRMLERAELARTASPLDRRDLRGWHFALTGGLLGTLSPYGFAAGMTGRYAYLQDSYDLCLQGLHRMRLLLDATGSRPRAVALLPDRGSRVLGLAAAELLGLPSEPFAPDRADTLVVAHDLTGTDPDAAARLRERAPGQVLFEHASCWTGPPAVTADITTLLHQTAVAPWGVRTRFTAEGEAERLPADDRSEAELAAEILRADPTPDPGDGETSADPEAALAAFAAAVRDRWLLGPRDPARSPGPVPSSRFR